jgi:hypothetical protein
MWVAIVVVAVGALLCKEELASWRCKVATDDATYQPTPAKSHDLEAYRFDRSGRLATIQQTTSSLLL